MVSEVWYGWSPELHVEMRGESPRAVVPLVDRRDLRYGEVAVGQGVHCAGVEGRLWLMAWLGSIGEEED